MQINIVNKETQIGQFDSCQYIPVDGAPVRADLFYQSYQLSLNGKVLDGRYTDKYLIHDSLLFVTSIDLEITEQETGILQSTRLLAIHMDSLKMTQLSKLENGFVYPVGIEGNKIVYTKQLLNSSAIKEFDQPINHLIK